MMAKPTRAVELYYPVIQFLIVTHTPDLTTKLNREVGGGGGNTTPIALGTCFVYL